MGRQRGTPAATINDNGDDRRGLKDEEVKAWPDVCLTFVYPEERTYLCLTGEASVGRNTDRALDLWNKK